ncbi:interleukin-12 receptor subunit beta-2-like [Ascaphus truei]|uniref:interleukin-12 receptor subunit beta-2-like n=1 Tax=Ascaphus truei TaxID=8439 RepID=UPI003F5A6CBD
MGHTTYRWQVAWIVIVFAMNMCEGFVECSGYITVEPAPVFLMGSNITITCISIIKDCSALDNLSMFLNDSVAKPDWRNQTSATIRLTDVRESYTVTCFINCKGREHLLCVAILHAGFPPDRPTNVTCSREEKSVYMMCAWERGQYTHIHTAYTVHLNNLQTTEEQIFVGSNNVTIPVNRSQDTAFEVVVRASNALGQSQSYLVHVLLEEIVVPVPPVIIQAEILNGSRFKILIQWRKQRPANCSCELGYGTVRERGPAWSGVEEQVLNKSNVLLMMISLEAQALRVRCREARGESYWSGWSHPYLIPETAPSGTFNVWRLLGPVYPNGSQEVIVLIQRTAPDFPWGRTVGYNVFCREGGEETVIQMCNKSEMQCSTAVPEGIGTIFIASYNSHGQSSPSHIPVRQLEADTNGFPAPQNVTITSGLQTSILVEWEPPEKTDEFVLWFVLQWLPAPCDEKQQNVSWQKVQRNETHFYIEDQIKTGRRLNISLYAVYSNGVSRPSTGCGFSQESKPIRGPSASVQTSFGDKILILWSDVPLCEQMGFITDYTIYFKEGSSGSVTQYKSSVRHFWFRSLNPDAIYSVCVTASTAAGKGPCGNSVVFIHVLWNRHPCFSTVSRPPILGKLGTTDFFPLGKSLQNYAGLLLGISFGAIILTAFALTLLFKKTIRRRIKTFVVSSAPKCLHEDYPHVENSTAVKSLQVNRGVISPCSPPLYSDPEITEVQEILLQENISYPILRAEYAEVTKNNAHNAESITLLNSPHINTPEQTVGYRPQTAQTNVGKGDSYCIPSHIALSSESDMVDPNAKALFWTSGTGIQAVGFQEVDFLLNSRNIKKHDIPGLLQTEPNVSLEYTWESQLSGGVIEAQTFPPEDRACCPTTGVEEFSGTKTYFPQMLARGT